jgi:lipopolysaccharide transport system permease protein
MDKIVLKDEEEWSLIISSNRSFFDLKLKQIWLYRDLLFLLVKRDFISFYKQTILGPLWFFIQPLFTTITFTVVFGNLAGISTDGLPSVLFYMAGITFWSYFAESLTKISGVFRDNASIFGKVYFPRIIMPLSIVFSNLVKFGIQLFLLFVLMIFYKVIGADFVLTIHVLLVPVAIVLMAALSLGLGMIISAMTTKYRDLAFIITFGIQLLMYATPVIYPLSSIPDQSKWLFLLNPMTQVIELVRLGLLGKGYFTWMVFGYDVVFILFVLVIGTLIFNRAEKDFVDTV